MTGLEDIPAVYVAHTDESFAELQAMVDAAIGTHVLLARDALTQRSTIAIGRMQPSTLNNPMPQGRVTEMPFRFNLVMRGDACFLLNAADESRYRLEKANCRAE